jgi:hypothetical protein
MGPHQRQLTRWFAQQFSRRLSLRDLDQPRIPGAVRPNPDHIFRGRPSQSGQRRLEWATRIEPEFSVCGHSPARCYDVEENRRTKLSAVSATSRQPESMTNE